MELPKGVFITIFPNFVAASRSTLSTPIPALPITLIFFEFSITSFVTLVAERTTKASQSSSSLIKLLVSRSVLIFV